MRMLAVLCECILHDASRGVYLLCMAARGIAPVTRTMSARCSSLHEVRSTGIELTSSQLLYLGTVSGSAFPRHQPIHHTDSSYASASNAVATISGISNWSIAYAFADRSSLCLLRGPFPRHLFCGVCGEPVTRVKSKALPMDRSNSANLQSSSTA
jgi:hypothetical protein